MARQNTADAPTAYQIELLEGIDTSDYDRPVWLWSAVEGIPEASRGGVVAKAVEAGLVHVDVARKAEDSTIDMTPKGEAALAAHRAKAKSGGGKAPAVDVPTLIALAKQANLHKLARKCERSAPFAAEAVVIVNGVLADAYAAKVAREREAAPHQDRPMASKGLTSYRIKGKYDYIMIGAKDVPDALKEAQRSSRDISPDDLEVWDGSKYVFVKPRAGTKAADTSGESPQASVWLGVADAVDATLPELSPDERNALKAAFRAEAKTTPRSNGGRR